MIAPLGGAAPTTRPAPAASAAPAPSAPAAIYPPTPLPGDDKPSAQIPDADPARRHAEMERWFSDLASADAKTRDAARVDLMGLGRSDLKSLHDLIQRRLPLAPEQAMALRDVVTQIYLAGEPYTPSQGIGFLGINMEPVRIDARPPADAARAPKAPDAPNAGPADQDAPDAVEGILVAYRLPGFCAARWFKDGDVILAVENKVALNPTDMDSAVKRFSVTISRIGPGNVARFQVLRQGQLIHISAVLNSRPADIGEGGGMEARAFIDPRLGKAEEYWSAYFAPLLEEKVQ